VTSSEFRLRVAYKKAGRLRFLSHLEVARTLERTARRADLPYAVTRGFSPHMKLAFGPALPVGTAGEREYMDIWLTEYQPAVMLCRRLEAVAVAELAPKDAGFVGTGEPSLSAACTIGSYEVVVDGDGTCVEALEDALTKLVADGKFAVEHKGKKKVFDLARSLPKEPVVGSHDRGAKASILVRMGPEGSLRPDVLVSDTILRSGIDASVGLVTRTDILIEKKEGVWRRPL